MTKLLSKFGKLSRFYLGMCLVLIPMAGIVAIVFATLYLPIIKSVDRLVEEVVHEIVPLVELESTLQHVAMLANRDLMSGDQDALEEWQTYVETADAMFDQIAGHFRSAHFQSTHLQETLTVLLSRWEKAKQQGRAALRRSEGASYNEQVALTSRFDAQAFAIIEELEDMHHSVELAVERLHQEVDDIKSNAIVYTAISLVAMMLIGGGAALYLKKDRRQLHSSSYRDALTGAANRRAFEIQLGKLTNPNKPESSFSLLMMDIDRFKTINDTLGHQVGDEAICYVVDRISLAKREPDFFARWAGDEFVMLLPSTPKDIALKVAERLRSHVEEGEVKLEDGSAIKVTVSIGVASYPESSSIEGGVMAAADKALYRSKEKGRNAVSA